MANTAINHDPVATFPGSSTNTAVVKWSGTSGDALLDSGVIIDGSNNVTGLNNVTATGYLHLTGDEKELRFYEGANYIAIAAPSGLGADYTFTLPLNDGAADEFLQTNGSGVLTWAAAAGTTINSNADNRVITGSGTANTLNGETNLTYSGTLLGINTASPDSGQYLHIVGAAGSVSSLTATTTSQLTVENNSNAAISILSPAADFGAVYFGDPGSNIAGGLIYNHGRPGFDVRVEGSTKFIMEADDFTINAGNLVIGTAGKGIDFSATANSSGGSMTSELFDDYEEGTWTPAISGSSYTTQIGRYVKSGKMVYVSAELNINSHGGSVRRVTGLPFTSANSSHVTSLNVSYFSGLATNVLWIGVYVENNAATLQFPNMTSAGVVVTSAAADIWGNSARVNFSGTYEAAS